MWTASSLAVRFIFNAGIAWRWLRMREAAPELELPANSFEHVFQRLVQAFTAVTDIVALPLGGPCQGIQVKSEMSHAAAYQLMIRYQQNKALNVGRPCQLLDFGIARG